MNGKADRVGKIRGKVEVRLSGRQTERLIKLCGKNGIELRRLTKEENGKAYRFVIWADEFLLLRPYLKKTKCRARVISREGAWFYLKRQRKRWMFPVGLLCGLIVLFATSQFIWKIDIKGNVYYSDDVIYRYLEEQDVSFGTLKAAVYGAGLEESIRNYFEEITWVSVQIIGTHMTVNVKEDDQLEAEVQSDEISNIIAAQDGVITSIVVRSGQTELKEGDTVTAGQILISGAVERKDDGGNITGTKPVHAEGEVYASVSYRYEDSFLLSHETREYQDETVVGYTLVLGKHRIPLPVLGTMGKYYDTVTERDQLYLGSDYYLPIYLEKTVYRSYMRHVEDYTREEADEVANKRMDEYLERLAENGFRIQNSEIVMEIKDGVCFVSGSYTAVSQIGVQQMISSDEA